MCLNAAVVNESGVGKAVQGLYGDPLAVYGMPAVLSLLLCRFAAAMLTDALFPCDAHPASALAWSHPLVLGLPLLQTEDPA